MSRKIHIDSIDESDREQIMKDLQIKIEGSTYVQNAQPSYVYPIEVGEDYAYIPFAYGRNCAGSPFPRPERKELGQLECAFEGRLRDHQNEVKTEAISHLNKYGSTVIAAYPGYGKCLGINTPVLMFDGTTKMVQDILPGEQVMGDDSFPRNVLSICKGKEQMYDIISETGESYRVNESHILSLKMPSHKRIITDQDEKYYVEIFDKKSLKFVIKTCLSEKDAIEYRNSITGDNILDIEVKEYIKMHKSIQAKFKGYKVPIIFEKKDYKLDPYWLGLWLGSGLSSGPLLYRIDKQIIEYLERLARNNNVTLKTHKTHKTTNELYNCAMTKKYPYGSNKIFDLLKKYNLLLNKHIPHDYKCNSRYIQLRVLAGIIDSIGYYRKGCFKIIQKREILARDIEFMCRSIGFVASVKKVNKHGIQYKVKISGPDLNDVISLLLRKKLKVNVCGQNKKTLMTSIKVVPVDPKEDNNYYGFALDGNRRFLLGDFTVTHNTAISIYIATKIKLKTLIISHRIVLINQWKDSIKKFCPNATVQVLSAKSAMKDCDFYIMNPANTPKHTHDFYKHIGLLICDEVHLIMAEGLSKCMQRIVPRYVLGLSATPYREDGLNVLLDLYFGKRRIYRKLFRKHRVYRIKTNFVPTVELAANGRINWGVLLDSQCNDKARNEMIIKLIQFFTTRVFLVLCKRIDQGNYLVRRLQEEGEDVTSLIGKQQEFEQKSRILIGISSKVGTGFDHPRLDALILASDIQAYFIQYLGRCMRTQDGVPMIFDIVDKNPILDKHFKVRRSIYLEHGGVITDFKNKYPEFDVI